MTVAGVELEGLSVAGLETCIILPCWWVCADRYSTAAPRSCTCQAFSHRHSHRADGSLSQQLESPNVSCPGCRSYAFLHSAAQCTDQNHDRLRIAECANLMRRLSSHAVSDAAGRWPLTWGVAPTGPPCSAARSSATATWTTSAGCPPTQPPGDRRPASRHLLCTCGLTRQCSGSASTVWMQLVTRYGLSHFVPAWPTSASSESLVQPRTLLL